MKHPFTEIIGEILEQEFPGEGDLFLSLSPLIQYLNHKTRSANRGSKSRGSFASLYALYVLVEDYVQGGFAESGDYPKYAGADFSPLLQRMRKLPFGSKLQNHALNNRVNDEFHKYFPDESRRPILRKVDLQKYWITESLLVVKTATATRNIARAILLIIDAYVTTKQASFDRFIRDCGTLNHLATDEMPAAAEFIRSLIAPDKDPRIFEITSYAVLKQFYAEEIIFIGSTRETVQPEHLSLFKTGRTNANDGGIDFVMRPLGRFFQVTETLDVKKYFLDIDKIERFPISFVIKTDLAVTVIRERLRAGALDQYSVNSVVESYMGAIEEIINVPILLERFDHIARLGKTRAVLDEIIRWSRVEFNANADDGEEEVDAL